MTVVNVSIYSGGPMMPGYKGPPANSAALMSTLGASGFTTLVGFTIWIETAVAGKYSDGDFSFNHLPLAADGTDVIVSNGTYNGPTAWASQLQALKDARNVTKIYFSTLGKFYRIKALLKDGKGQDNILYKNFAALKAALPIDGIDLDDEDLWDQDTTVALSNMLNTLGYEVSFCPYGGGSADYWAKCLAALNTTQTPNVVSGFNLQCYGGGSPSDLQTYVEAIQNEMSWTAEQAAAFITPGLWCRRQEVVEEGTGTHKHKVTKCVGSAPADFTSQFADWHNDQNLGSLQGGFVYILDSLVNAQSPSICDGASMQDYANSIIAGAPAPTTTNAKV